MFSASMDNHIVQLQAEKIGAEILLVSCDRNNNYWQSHERIWIFVNANIDIQIMN